MDKDLNLVKIPFILVPQLLPKDKQQLVIMATRRNILVQKHLATLQFMFKKQSGLTPPQVMGRLRDKVLSQPGH